MNIELMELRSNSYEIFNGFYSTLISLESIEEWTNEGEDEQDLTEIPCGEPAKKYFEAVAEAHTKNVDYAIKMNTNMEVLQGVKYVSLYSPQYYNFETDKIDWVVEFCRENLERYCFSEKRREFEQYLKDNFTSYDGFHSWFANNIDDFKRDLIKCEYKYDLERNTNVMIEFYMLQELDFEYIHSQTFEDAQQYYWENCTKVWEVAQ